MGEKELIISSGIIGDSKVYLKQFFYNIIWVKITPEIEIKDSTYKAFVNSYPYMKAEEMNKGCLLYTSDAADDTPCVDLGGRRIIKKKKKKQQSTSAQNKTNTKKQKSTNKESP
eukprot:TRINITY_DN67621_c0_g1_i4.p3 TRINITY_DN67621_c0_g1~~TRINITY_DN67621_c0_g1_i4.p3  ORF type:complete len:132 (-),score=34.81 TRINITY_DN67621_c0_g1_i4:20-361(-)